MVAGQGGAAQRDLRIGAAGRVKRTREQIAQVDDQIRRLSKQVCQYGFEGKQVAMDVSKNSDAHYTSLRPPNGATVKASSSPNPHRFIHATPATPASDRPLCLQALSLFALALRGSGLAVTSPRTMPISTAVPMKLIGPS